MLKTAIPFVDLRGKTPVDLLRAYPDKAHAIIAASRKSHGKLAEIASHLVLPVMDWRSLLWLKRTKNPYLHEMESCADILRQKGVFSLNLSYEWFCTTGAYRTDETVTMLRLLDWQFPGLGQHAMVVRQSGKVGDFYNVTWPGATGVFSAMAPKRFCVAINQAPMRKHHLKKAGDWLKNRAIMRSENGLPPAHLLRQVCEQAVDYAQAKDMLLKTSIALPAIFTLSGTKPGEGCVIERLERTGESRDLQADQVVATANHFNTLFAEVGPGWWLRGADSEGRQKQACGVAGHDLQEIKNFEWLRPPMLNPDTRLCMVMDAATSRLMVQGFEGVAVVTELFDLPRVANDAA